MSLGCNNMLIHKPFFAVLGLALGLLLTGCVTSNIADPSAGGFLARGKLSARPGTAGVPFRPITANFVWRQEGETFDIELWGPLGQGRSRLTGTTQSVEWVDAQGQRQVSPDPQGLMQAQFGWSLPLEALPFWMQGRLPARPRPTQEQRSPNGDLLSAQQNDWSLQFSRYKDHPKAGATVRRPGLVRGQNAELQVSISIREWR